MQPSITQPSPAPSSGGCRAPQLDPDTHRHRHPRVDFRCLPLISVCKSQHAAEPPLTPRPTARCHQASLNAQREDTTFIITLLANGSSLQGMMSRLSMISSRCPPTSLLHHHLTQI